MLTLPEFKKRMAEGAYSTRGAACKGYKHAKGLTTDELVECERIVTRKFGADPSAGKSEPKRRGRPPKDPTKAAPAATKAKGKAADAVPRKQRSAGAENRYTVLDQTTASLAQVADVLEKVKTNVSAAVVDNGKMMVAQALTRALENCFGPTNGLNGQSQVGIGHDGKLVDLSQVAAG